MRLVNEWASHAKKGLGIASIASSADILDGGTPPDARSSAVVLRLLEVLRAGYQHVEWDFAVDAICAAGRQGGHEGNRW